MVNGVKSPYAEEFEVYDSLNKKGAVYKRNLNTKMLHISYVQRKMMHQKGKSIHKKKPQKKNKKKKIPVCDQRLGPFLPNDHFHRY